MDPRISDPNNHAPEVAPDDVWGDAHALQPRISGASAVLPPKRSLANPRPHQKAAPDEAPEGLRIESKTAETPADEPETSLEVQKIDGSVVRLNPENSDSPPKVPRQFTFLERPADSKPVADKHWGSSGKTASRWIIGTGLGVASLVIAALMALPLINKSNAARPGDEQLELAADDFSAAAMDSRLEELITRQPEAQQAFRSFASATIADDFLPFIRDAGSVESLIRSAVQAPGISNDWRPDDNTTWKVNSIDGTAYGMLEGGLPNYSTFTAYLVLADDDRLLLDWKASTGFGTATFEQLARHTGDPSEIRAWLVPDTFYTLVYPESDFQCYQLTSPHDDAIIWSYTPRDGDTDKEIRKLFKSGEILEANTSPKRVTLRLERGPDDSLPNQWSIAQQLHVDWIQP